MITEDHDGPGRKERVEAACGIGDDQSSGPEKAQDPNRKGHIPGRIALVKVKSALKHDQRMAVDPAQDQVALVTLNRRSGERGQLRVRNDQFDVEPIGKRAQAGAQLDNGCRAKGQPFVKEVDAGLDLLPVALAHGQLGSWPWRAWLEIKS